MKEQEFHNVEEQNDEGRPLIGSNIQSHQTLASLQSFWIVLWQFVIEVVCLSGLLFFFFHKPQHEEHNEENHERYLKSLRIVTLLAPSVVIFASLISFVAPRGNRIANFIYFILMIISLLLGLVGAIFVARDFDIWRTVQDCEETEFKGWNPITIQTLILAFVFWPLPFRVATVVSSHKLIKEPEVVATRYWTKKPELKGLKRAIDIMNGVITFCCMPICCQGVKGDNQHKAHHVVQLLYEMAIFIVSAVEHKNLEIVSIVGGLIGSSADVLKFFHLGIIFNVAAIILYVSILAVEFSHLECDYFNWYLVSINAIANVIRIKSVVHSYVENQEQLWDWLSESSGTVKYAKSEPLFFLCQKCTSLITLSSASQKN